MTFSSDVSLVMKTHRPYHGPCPRHYFSYFLDLLSVGQRVSRRLALCDPADAALHGHDPLFDLVGEAFLPGFVRGFHPGQKPPYITHRVLGSQNVDRLGAGILIQPEPELLRGDHEFSCSLDESGLIDLRVRKNLAGPTLTVVEKDVDVSGTVGLQVNLKIVMGAQNAPFTD